MAASAMLPGTISNLGASGLLMSGAPCCAKFARLQIVGLGVGDGGLPLLLPGAGQWELLLDETGDPDLQPVGADPNVVDHHQVAVAVILLPDDPDSVELAQALLVQRLQQRLLVILLLQRADVGASWHADGRSARARCRRSAGRWWRPVGL